MKDPYKRRVKDVMNKEVVIAHQDDTVQDALAWMMENRVTALPVISRDQCIGIISLTDFMEELEDDMEAIDRLTLLSQDWLTRQLEDHELSKKKVQDIMSLEVVTVNPEDTLVHAAQLMLSNRVHRLPVVDKKGHLHGIISTSDIMTAFVEGIPD